MANFNTATTIGDGTATDAAFITGTRTWIGGEAALASANIENFAIASGSDVIVSANDTTILCDYLGSGADGSENIQGDFHFDRVTIQANNGTQRSSGTSWTFNDVTYIDNTLTGTVNIGQFANGSTLTGAAQPIYTINGFNVFGNVDGNLAFLIFFPASNLIQAGSVLNGISLWNGETGDGILASGLTFGHSVFSGLQSGPAGFRPFFDTASDARALYRSGFSNALDDAWGGLLSYDFRAIHNDASQWRFAHDFAGKVILINPLAGIPTGRLAFACGSSAFGAAARTYFGHNADLLGSLTGAATGDFKISSHGVSGNMRAFLGSYATVAGPDTGDPVGLYDLPTTLGDVVTIESGAVSPIQNGIGFIHQDITLGNGNVGLYSVETANAANIEYTQPVAADDLAYRVYPWQLTGWGTEVLINPTAAGATDEQVNSDRASGIYPAAGGSGFESNYDLAAQFNLVNDTMTDDYATVALANADLKVAGGVTLGTDIAAILKLHRYDGITYNTESTLPYSVNGLDLDLTGNYVFTDDDATTDVVEDSGTFTLPVGMLDVDTMERITTVTTTGNLTVSGAALSTSDPATPARLAFEVGGDFTADAIANRNITVTGNATFNGAVDNAILNVGTLASYTTINNSVIVNQNEFDFDPATADTDFTNVIVRGAVDGDRGAPTYNWPEGLQVGDETTNGTIQFNSVPVGGVYNVSFEPGTDTANTILDVADGITVNVFGKSSNQFQPATGDGDVNYVLEYVLDVSNVTTGIAPNFTGRWSIYSTISGTTTLLTENSAAGSDRVRLDDDGTYRIALDGDAALGTESIQVVYSGIGFTDFYTSVTNDDGQNKPTIVIDVNEQPFPESTATDSAFTPQDPGDGTVLTVNVTQQLQSPVDVNNYMQRNIKATTNYNRAVRNTATANLLRSLGRNGFAEINSANNWNFTSVFPIVLGYAQDGITGVQIQASTSLQRTKEGSTSADINGSPVQPDGSTAYTGPITDGTLFPTGAVDSETNTTGAGISGDITRIGIAPNLLESSVVRGGEGSVPDGILYNDITGIYTNATGSDFVIERLDASFTRTNATTADITFNIVDVPEEGSTDPTVVLASATESNAGANVLIGEDLTTPLSIANGGTFRFAITGGSGVVGEVNYLGAATTAGTTYNPVVLLATHRLDANDVATFDDTPGATQNVGVWYPLIPVGISFSAPPGFDPNITQTQIDVGVSNVNATTDTQTTIIESSLDQLEQVTADETGLVITELSNRIGITNDTSPSLVERLGANLMPTSEGGGAQGSLLERLGGEETRQDDGGGGSSISQQITDKPVTPATDLTGIATNAEVAGVTNTVTGLLGDGTNAGTSTTALNAASALSRIGTPTDVAADDTLFGDINSIDTSGGATMTEVNNSLDARLGDGTTAGTSTTAINAAATRAGLGTPADTTDDAVEGTSQVAKDLREMRGERLLGLKPQSTRDTSATG